MTLKGKKGGGGLLKLVERELKLSKTEARQWALEFLGFAIDLKTPDIFTKPVPNNKLKDESDWVSLKADSTVPAPTLENIGKLHLYYKEIARNAYHDEQGNLLYYVLRLQDKNDPMRKITPPLSYGHFKNQPTEPSWELRGYKDDNERKSLYNLQILKAKPLLPILIVEGEKAADKALEQFPNKDFICMTWPSGASSVSKADWSPLFGRDVFIWPDNDEAGFRAAQQVCDELKKIGAGKIHITERKELFDKLPPKWDLADPLPAHVKASPLDFYLKSDDKNRFQRRVLTELDLKEKLSFADRLRAVDLLYAYEKTNKERFEKDFSKDLSPAEKGITHSKHVHEGIAFIKKKGEIYKQLTTDPTINASGQLAKRLAYQVHLYEAKYGKAPSENQILLMRETIQTCIKDLDSIKKESTSQDIKDLAIDRSLVETCENALKRHKIDSKNAFEAQVRLEICAISRQQERETNQHQVIVKEHTMQKDLSRSLSL